MLFQIVLKLGQNIPGSNTLVVHRCPGLDPTKITRSARHGSGTPLDPTHLWIWIVIFETNESWGPAAFENSVNLQISIYMQEPFPSDYTELMGSSGETQGEREGQLEPRWVNSNQADP